ncbi:MAG: hypothetical protein JO048_10915, partial [Methylobacteriaceae bacterium]|nr:hypothetical protein [Methylobacteriaceae bacterium]
MQIAVFLTVEAPGRQVSGADLETAAAAIGALPGLRGALLYHPVEDAPDHPFAADGSGPAFAAELRFDERPAAEAALSPERLGRLAWPSLGACTPRLGLFAVRDFATPDPTPRSPEPCTFLVRYEGVAAD